jgi:hypothetical protein
MRALLIVALCLTVLAGPITPTGATELEAAACTPLVEGSIANVDGLVPYQSLAQGNVFDHGPPRSLLIVSSKADPITTVVSPSAAQAVASVDLGSNVLVGLFIGRWPQDGHRVTIESVRATDSGVCITAVVTGPGPDEDAADAETYPYHVVAVPRASLPQEPGTTWTAVSPDGTVIATRKLP